MLADAMKRAPAAAAIAVAALAAVTAAPAGQTASVPRAASVAGTATTPGNPWPPEAPAEPSARPLSPEEAVRTFSTPPGYRVELVAAEPLIESPILIDFDADGRLWALEMLSFLPDASGRDAREPLNRVVVLEDLDDDGRMDKRTVFADRLLMPRALKVLDQGVLVGEPPNLWLMRDTNGDLTADTKTAVAGNYGNPGANIEHNANGTLWAMDNVIYSSEHAWNLRFRNGAFESVPALSRGQWQISQDDAGRVYRNVNDSPLFVDYTPAHYFLRNPNSARTRGLYELLIEQMDATIYPVRPTRGVNRGYRDPFFRSDGSSIVVQGAGTPTIYRGDQYPASVRGTALVTDSPTNLVHQFTIVDDGTGRLSARNTWPRGEFLASSDERFRPVSLASGPDGTMYVVDMYRGVVQAGGLWSEYLSAYIKSRSLELPVGRGRIWRVVHGTGASRRGPRPALSKATPATLVDALSHPNGWWRDMAQQLLVQRRDRSIAPALVTLARSAPDWRTRLHALWTLDGLDAIDPAAVERAVRDVNPDVRAAGIRIGERWLRQPGHPLAAIVVTLTEDRSFTVRRQLAASIGELPAAARVAPSVTMLVRNGTDPIVVDAMVSGLRDLEGEVLDRVLASSGRPTEAMAMLTAAVAKSGSAEGVERVLTIVSDASQPAWRRMALLQGLDAALPGGGRGGRGGGGLPGLSTPGGRIVVTPGRGVSLPAEPRALTRLAAGSSDLARLAKRVADKLDWPGRPTPSASVAPLTAAEQQRSARGAGIYRNVCAACHGDDGRGRQGLGGDLVESAYITAGDATAAIRILLSGKEGAIGLMPPLGRTLSDEDIASALTYARGAWGHTGSAVDPLHVMEMRALSKSRTTPWTDAELQQGGRRGGGRGRASGRGGN